MAYTRLIVLVIVFEVLMTVIVGMGIYFGFSIFPYSPSSLTSSGTAVQTGGFLATIPLYMPSLTDLKIPYTYLQTWDQAWGIEAVLVSLAVLGLQSFVRGMYLGGLKGWILSHTTVSLLTNGRKYFGGMLAWSIFQSVTGIFIVLFAKVFIPVGLLLMIAILFYSLTPYLMVLQDMTFSDALSKAPRMFRRCFGTLLPLALFAMLCTLVISLFRSLSPPWGYAVPLLAYSCIGTYLIGELLRKLAGKLTTLDGKQVSDQPFGEARTRGMVNVFIMLLVPVLIGAGMFVASGRFLSLLDIGDKSRIDGISYNTNFSDVFYASKQAYTAYEWQSKDYSISIKLPVMTGEEKPDELRGIADITWQMDEEIRIMQGNSTRIDVQSGLHKSQVMYRLVRQSANNGSTYYSSMNGSASILPGGKRPREPLSIQIMVSGDGSHIFALQYPSRFDVSRVFRVSDDGKYLIPGTSPVNPMDFHAYWFTTDQNAGNVFDILVAKNKTNDITTINRAYLALACAMQEGDGRMVVKLLETMRQAGVNVTAPDWDDLTWTDNLHHRYHGATLPLTLELLSKAGVQGSYVSQEIVDKSDENIGVYRFEVPFPDGMIPITYSESKKDGKLLSIHVLD
ncbi:hypothetical protein A8709_17795 [Paenibacillus pectinilyticus]|uniref:Uncharacterized protein n=1 Tax=Paenibacillus pectinilyticus TaxID=512399 RepID=A0A1C0ZZC7_9BACL|nr:hypothetical protein [Paenibacillus pectinilyticus]OCT13459.1 hypothetical protein A8709_17795 [Paenibacillus pectinilyticus]